jgi:hypothetical protein
VRKAELAVISAAACAKAIEEAAEAAMEAAEEAAIDEAERRANRAAASSSSVLPVFMEEEDDEGEEAAPPEGEEARPPSWAFFWRNRGAGLGTRQATSATLSDSSGFCWALPEQFAIQGENPTFLARSNRPLINTFFKFDLFLISLYFL